MLCGAASKEFALESHNICPTSNNHLCPCGELEQLEGQIRDFLHTALQLFRKRMRMWEFFFDVDSVVTKSGIGWFFDQDHHRPFPSAPSLCKPVLIVPALRLTAAMMIFMPVTVPLALSRQVQAIVICSLRNQRQVGEPKTVLFDR